MLILVNEGENYKSKENTEGDCKIRHGNAIHQHMSISMKVEQRKTTSGNQCISIYMTKGVSNQTTSECQLTLEKHLFP